MTISKFELGATIETISPSELQEILRQYVQALGQGAKFRRVMNSVDVNTNALNGEGVGPSPGYIWEVKSLKCSIPSATTVGTTNWYWNVNNPINFIINVANATTTAPAYWAKNQLILHPGETLVPVLSGVTQGPATLFNSVLSVIEVPVGQEGQLLL